MSETGCGQRPSVELRRAIVEFNEREFFACHETLEALWIDEAGPIRELYQGILQIAVAFYHLRRKNQRGAILCLERGLERLRRFPSACRGIDVARLVEDAETALGVLVGGGAGSAIGTSEQLELTVRLHQRRRQPADELH